MPVIQVQCLPLGEAIDVPSVIRAVSCAAAEVLAVSPPHVWVVWQTIEPFHYTEGQNCAPAPSSQTHPPIVNVMAYEGRPPELVERVLETIARTLCEQLRMDEGNAFITYTELKAGRVYTGGAVR